MSARDVHSRGDDGDDDGDDGDGDGAYGRHHASRHHHSHVARHRHQHHHMHPSGAAAPTTPVGLADAKMSTRAVPLSEPKVTSAMTSAEAETKAHISDIIRQSKSRWLKNTEVCDVLLNYPVYEFGLSLDAPYAPSAGTLFLIDRKTVRFFRKDGHNWQKKKDGKTVRETHEKLKVGTVELLNCYYTHCEDDPRFQRRCYWLLNSDEGAVLVHYLKVRAPGGKSGGGSEGRSAQNSGGSSGKQRVDATSGAPVHVASGSGARRRGTTMKRESGSRRDPAATHHALQSFFGGSFGADEDSRSHVNDLLSRDDVDFAQLFGDDVFGDYDSQQLYAAGHHQNEVSTSMARAPSLSLGSLMRDFHDEDTGMSNERSNEGLNSHDDSIQEGDVSPVSLEELERRIQRIRASLQGLSTDTYAKDAQNIEKQITDLERSARRRATAQPSASFEDNDKDAHSGQRDTWITTTATTGEDSLNDCDEPVTSAPAHRRTVERRIPATLTGVHVLWSIMDFSPSWDDIKGGAKVIITGEPQVEFDGDVSLCVIFGNTAVPAERLAPNVIRCTAPAHSPGVVSMYITVADGNRHPISEICSFEYIDSSVGRSQNRRGGSKVVDEEMSDRDFQCRLIQLLTTMGSERSSSAETEQPSGSGDGADTRKNANPYDFMSQSMMHMNALSALRAAASMHADPFNLSVISDEDLKLLFENMMQARLKSVIVHENRRTKSRLALPQAAIAISQVEEVVKTGLVPDDSLVELVVERTYEAQEQLMNLALAPSAYRRKDHSGLTMFHCCAALGIDWAIKAMCATGIDLNHLDNSRRSALHWAVARGHETVVATLLNAGAKSRILAQWLDKTFTPADLAVACGHMGIAAYISEANLTSALSNIELRSKGVRLPISKLGSKHIFRDNSRDSGSGFQVKRTTLPSDDSGSDDADADDPMALLRPRRQHATTRALASPSSRHRPKKTNKTNADASNLELPYDSETEALSVIKRAEFAKKKLYSVMRDFKTDQVYMDAELSTHIAQLGKRRTRQQRQFNMPAEQMQDVMDRLLKPAEDIVHAAGPERRPAVRARRVTTKPKATVLNSKYGDTTESTEIFMSDENEEDIQHDVARIQEVAQSAHARAQYLRLRRIANQLQVELHALSTGIGAEYDED